MDWSRESHSWPNSDASRFVDLDGMRWHIQQMGEGPQIVLLHGSGATTHSFGKLLPDLARSFDITAIDLPGHGFTTPMSGGRPSLPGVSRALAQLLLHEKIAPAVIAGHSAGAAIAVYATADNLWAPEALVAINGAFYPFAGFAGHIFPAAAKLLFLNPLAPRLFAFGAGSRRRVVDLIRSTGSKLDDEGIDFYQRALMSSRHVEGTLAMMANWDLAPMERHLQALDVPLLQIIGGRDGTVDPGSARHTAALLAKGEIRVFEDCGHLVHEEKPDAVADAIRRFAADHDILHQAGGLRKKI